MGRRHRVVLVCVVLLCTAPVAAQDPDSPANPRRPFWKLFTDLANDFKHLPSRDTLVWLSIGGATALAAHPLDDDVNARFTGDPWVADVFAPGAIAGQTYVVFGTAAITYTWGRLAKQPRVAHIGVDLLRAQLMTYAMTHLVKATTNRERPDGSNDRSFPSGHASLTFATATVLQRHFGWRGALGLVAGRTATRHGRNQWTVTPALTPDGGYALTVTVYSHTP